ncbi:MAG: hypothetical protein ACLUKN_02405 [Bacilli bacterium]
MAEFDGTESEAEEGARRFVEILSDYGARMAKAKKKPKNFGRSAENLLRQCMNLAIPRLTRI